MRLLILPFITALLHYTKAETGDAYHGPPQARELFTYNDKFYYFYSDRCTYEEAKAICEAGNMHLTTLDEPAKAKFAAESIAEAWMVFEDMWIGAKKHQNGRWAWDFTGKHIPEEPQLVGNHTFLYPPWVDNEFPSRDGKDCLAIDRNGHNDPYFVDLDCKLPRPFICEQNIRQNNTDPFNGGVVEIYDIEFILYHGRLTWSAAVSFCRQQGYALATIENMSVARKLAKAMLKSRPEFEDAWIGANLKDDQWTWVETGEEIKSVPAEYKDPHRGEVPDNIAVPQFPPWFESEPRKGRDCVIFDRHLCEEPKFIDLRCDRQRDFICIKREQIKDQSELTLILDREKKRYIFFPVTATWDEAKKICDEESENTTMLNLTDIEETKFIMQAMSDARNPIDHLWLGGRIVNAEWVWIGKDPEGSDSIPISKIPDETGFPPWCDNETNADMSCLNLDRQNHWTPLIYGLECNSTQAVVCVQPVEPNDRIVKYEGPNQQDPVVSLRITKLVANPISANEAQKACSREVGKLWRPRFDLPDSKSAIDKFFAAVKSGQDLDRSNVEVYHVDGGTYNAKQNAWKHSGKMLNISTSWEPYDGDCLVGQINKTATEWTWYPVKCYHKLYSQVICQPYCSLSEINYEEEKTHWVCDAASSEIFDHKMTGMGCNHRCPDNTVSEGPDRFYCHKERGWFSSQATVQATASRCRNVTEGLQSLKPIPEGITLLIFVIDSTSDSPADYNATKFLIGNVIDIYQSEVPNVVVHVVSIETDANGEGAVVKVSRFTPTGDCEQIKKVVLDPLIDTGEGARDYAAALAKVKEIGGEELGEAVVVFIVPETNQKGSFKEKAKDINHVAKVYAIGTNRHAPINQLVDIASTMDDHNYAIQFKKPPDVVQAVKALVATCGKCKCSSAFADIVADLEQRKDGAANDAPNPTPSDAPIAKRKFSA